MRMVTQQFQIIASLFQTVSGVLPGGYLKEWNIYYKMQLSFCGVGISSLEMEFNNAVNHFRGSDLDDAKNFLCNQLCLLHSLDNLAVHPEPG